jgi:acetoin:2,6-dichlorophenolindophenol oxidoreductase subunit beta
MDQIVNQLAKIRYMFGGQLCCPVTIRAISGAGFRAGAHHSGTWHSMLANVPGLKVVLPSTAYDAKGLLKSAIRDNNPVIFLEHKKLYYIKGPVPEEEYVIPLGQADVKRSGSDVTVVATQWMVSKAFEAAESLERDGISIEIIDPRSIVPLDRETITASVRKTHHLVVIDESPPFCGLHAEIIAVAVEDCFDYLDAPPRRIGPPAVPWPVSPVLEDYLLPNSEKIAEVIRGLL